MTITQPNTLSGKVDAVYTIGKDRVYVYPDKIIVYAPFPHHGWSVSMYRKTIILFQAQYYFVSDVNHLADGRVCYHLTLYDTCQNELHGVVFEYSEETELQTEQAQNRKKLKNMTEVFVWSLQPVLGFLPSCLKHRIYASWGYDPHSLTLLSITEEFFLLIPLVMLIFFMGFLGVSDLQLKMAAIASVTLFCDLLIRKMIMSESVNIYPGFLEWLPPGFFRGITGKKKKRPSAIHPGDAAVSSMMAPSDASFADPRQGDLIPPEDLFSRPVAIRCVEYHNDRITEFSDGTIEVDAAIDMPSWRVSPYRKTKVVFENTSYLIAQTDFTTGSRVRYRLVQWQSHDNDLPGAVCDYTSYFVAERDTAVRNSYKNRIISFLVFSGAPFVGLLYENKKVRIQNQYELSPEKANRYCLFVQCTILFSLLASLTLDVLQGRRMFLEHCLLFSLLGIDCIKRVQFQREGRHWPGFYEWLLWMINGRSS